MSARVFNPLVMSEMRRMLGRSSSDGSGSTAAVARVRRDLFGPINREDAESFAQKELAMLHQRETEKWGFDFEREAPVSVEHPRFRWERVSPQENCPHFYANRRLLAQSESSQKRDASTNTVAATTDRPTTTTLRVKTARKQSQITDYMRCRKRSLSVGDVSQKGGNAGDIPSPRRFPVGCAAKRSRQ